MAIHLLNMFLLILQCVIIAELSKLGGMITRNIFTSHDLKHENLTMEIFQSSRNSVKVDIINIYIYFSLNKF